MASRAMRFWKWRLLKQRAVAGCLAAVLKTVDPKIDTFWHIGIGGGDDLTAIHAAFPDAKHIGVDPISDHDLLGWCFSVAAWRSAGTIPFYDRGVSSSVFRVNGPEGTQRDVPCDTLDAISRLVPAAKRIAICMDCEGAELAVLEGAQNLLAITSAITIELCHGRPRAIDREEWPRALTVIAKLEEYGFGLLIEIGKVGRRPRVDAVFVRRDLH